MQQTGRQLMAPRAIWARGIGKAASRPALLALCLLLAACQQDDGPAFPGYVEGDNIQIAPEVAGRVLSLQVAEGETVAADALLATLEATAAEIEVAQARATLAEAEAVLGNLEQGGRPLEIQALTAAVAALAAENRKAAEDLARAEALFSRQVLSQALRDSARAAAELTAARLAEAKARLDLALAPSRDEMIDAQRHRVEAAAATLKLAEWRLGRHALRAGTAGQVEQILRRPGEIAGPSAPVLLFRPEGALRVIFFVEAAERPDLAPGDVLEVSCAGCTATTATVARLYDNAEFTPPVIFSETRTQALSWRAEGVLPPDADLSPGQVVTLRPRS